MKKNPIVEAIDGLVKNVLERRRRRRRVQEQLLNYVDGGFCLMIPSSKPGRTMWRVVFRSFP